MNTIKYFSITTCLLLLSACLGPTELSVTLIEDDYAKINGGTPVKDYYYISGFKNTKESLIALFYYLENNKVLPHKKVAYIVDNKNGVLFDDGTSQIKKSNKYVFIIQMTRDGYYDDIYLDSDYYISSYEFTKKNKQPYDITHVDKKSLIQMSYSQLNIEFLQHFLNIIGFERRQNNNPEGIYTYQLKNQKNQNIEAEIIYYNEKNKGLDNVFTISINQ